MLNRSLNLNGLININNININITRRCQEGKQFYMQHFHNCTLHRHQGTHATLNTLQSFCKTVTDHVPGKGNNRQSGTNSIFIFLNYLYYLYRLNFYTFKSSKSL